MNTTIHFFNLMWTFSGLLIHCNHGLHLYHHTVVLPIIYYRSTPIECLHTLLLGPFKYMTEQLMTRLTASQKREVKAKLRGFDFSPFPCSLSPGVCNHYLSFHGRDFKILAQVGLFIFWDHLLPTEKPVWLSLCKVYK